MPAPLRALIFDFDGLILDTEYPEFLSWQAVYRHYGQDLEITTWKPGLPKNSISLDQPPYIELEQRVGHPLDRNSVRTEREAIYAELLSREEILPGVCDLFSRAVSQGLLLAIASSSPRNWVGPALVRLGLAQLFDRVWCGDDVLNPKPNPELYLKAIQSLGVAPQEALAFEDSEVGISAAVSAGLRVVAIPNRLTVHSNLSAASVILPTMVNADIVALAQLA